MKKSKVAIKKIKTQEEVIQIVSELQKQYNKYIELSKYAVEDISYSSTKNSNRDMNFPLTIMMK